MSYMTPQLSDIVMAYVAERGHLGRSHPELLTFATRDRAFTVTAIRRLFRRWGVTLGFRVTPHMLRHTYALLLRQSGVPDRVSMDLLGHHSLSMLQRYSHVFDGEHQREAAKVILDV
jgi:integrase